MSSCDTITVEAILLTMNKAGLKPAGLLLLLALVSLVSLALAADEGQARTITVDDDGGADYEKIQDAVNASEDGDEIRVYAGTYHENVEVNRTVSLIGNGSEETTIDGSSSGDDHVVTITAGWVNITGFAVTESGSSDSFGGIYIGEVGNCALSDNKCLGNVRGIRLDSSSHCTIINNTCQNNDVGIRLGASSHCTITNNTCKNSIYGIGLYSSSDNTLTNNTCSSNNINGIYLRDSSECAIENNTCSSNNDNGIVLTSSSRY